MADREKFLNLVKKDKYQVFLFVSRANLPFFFAIHPWLVVNNRGTISRFGVAWDRNMQPIPAFGELSNQGHWGHLYRNYFPPWQGIGVFPFFWRYFWRGYLLQCIEGDENSTAKQIVEFVEKSEETYPHKENYSLLGPNSNTYVQWVLDNFPNSGLRLPWNSFGKHHPKAQPGVTRS